MKRTLFVYILLTFLFAGCQGPGNVDKSTEPLIKKKGAKGGFISFNSNGEIKVDEKLLEKYNFEVLWTFPLKKRITKCYLIKDALYVYTPSEKALYSFDRRSGHVKWFFVLKEGLTFKPALWEYNKEDQKITGIYKSDEVAVISQNRVYIIEKEHGNEITSIPLGGIAPSAPPGIHKYNVFVCGWDNRIYAFSKESGIEVWRYLTDGDIKAQPLATSDYIKSDLVFVGSTDGRIYGLNATNGNPKWREPIRTYGEILDAPTYLKQKIYVGSADSNVYCIEAATGRKLWTYICESPVLQSPVAIYPTIYVLANKGFLYALHYSRGTLLWRYPSPKDTIYLTSGEVITGKILNDSELSDQMIVQTSKGRQVLEKSSIKEIIWGSHKINPNETVVKILARGKKNLYVLNRKKEILALDSDKGVLLWKINAANVDFFMTNPKRYSEDSPLEEKRDAGVIFLGFQNGWLLAIREKE